MSSVANMQEPSILPNDTTAVLVANPEGVVVKQNAPALSLTRGRLGSYCWDLVPSIEGVCGLPCERGCVGRYLRKGSNHAHTSAVAIRGERFSLSCVPLGTEMVVVLSPVVRERSRNGASFTPREMDVLRLLADGLTTRSMASRLALSEATVRAHIEHMRNKVGLSTRAALVAYGYRKGYLDS